MLPAWPRSQSGVSSAAPGSGLGPPSGGRGGPAVWRLRGVSMEVDHPAGGKQGGGSRSAELPRLTAPFAHQAPGPHQLPRCVSAAEHTEGPVTPAPALEQKAMGHLVCQPPGAPPVPAPCFLGSDRPLNLAGTRSPPVEGCLERPQEPLPALLGGCSRHPHMAPPGCREGLRPWLRPPPGAGAGGAAHLSGPCPSAQGAPGWIQWQTQKPPATDFGDSVRDSFLRNRGFTWEASSATQHTGQIQFLAAGSDPFPTSGSFT